MTNPSAANKPLPEDQNRRPTPPHPFGRSKESAEDGTGIVLRDAVFPVQPDLDRLQSKIGTLIPTESRSAKSIVSYTLGNVGKRIRPALYYMCSKLLGYQGPYLDEIAAVGELVHTASLLHDDVVDNSTLRRGLTTANTTWGDQSAVLVGDLIYSRASELMASAGNMEIVATFANAIRLMSEGELLQLENAFNFSMPREVYFRIVECKTATLIAAVCRSAGLLARAPERDIEALDQFGYNVGIAFQLIDDALDYTSVSVRLGKPALQDLPDGKVTLPIIWLRERLNPEERKSIESALRDQPINEQQMDQVVALVSRYDAVQASLATAKTFTTKAMRALDGFAQSQARDDLEALAGRLLHRLS